MNVEIIPQQERELLKVRPSKVRPINTGTSRAFERSHFWTYREILKLFLEIFFLSLKVFPYIFYLVKTAKHKNKPIFNYLPGAYFDQKSCFICNFIKYMTYITHFKKERKYFYTPLLTHWGTLTLDCCIRRLTR